MSIHREKKKFHSLPSDLPSTDEAKKGIKNNKEKNKEKKIK